MISIKRAYEPSSKDDGFRILVDKLWPRGVSKEKVNLDIWMKEIAPSDDLRKWFSHDPKRWKEFENKYENALKHEAKENASHFLCIKNEVFDSIRKS